MNLTDLNTSNFQGVVYSVCAPFFGGWKRHGRISVEFRGIETPQLPKPVQQRSVEAEKSRSQGVGKWVRGSLQRTTFGLLNPMKNEGLKPLKYGYVYIYIHIIATKNLKVVGSQVGGYGSFCMPLHINYRWTDVLFSWWIFLGGKLLWPRQVRKEVPNGWEGKGCH